MFNFLHQQRLNVINFPQSERKIKFFYFPWIFMLNFSSIDLKSAKYMQIKCQVEPSLCAVESILCAGEPWICFLCAAICSIVALLRVFSRCWMNWYLVNYVTIRMVPLNNNRFQIEW